MKSFKILFLAITIANILSILNSYELSAGNLISVTDQLTTSQLSYFARMSTGVATGQGVLKIDTVTSTNPSKSTANLFVGDTIAIGSTNGSGDKILTNYQIASIGSTSELSTATNLSGDDNIAGQAIIATRSAIHTVTFTPISGVGNGKFQFLLKTANNLTVGETDSNGENGRDGIPDQNGFDTGADVGSTAGLGSNVDSSDVYCPSGMTASVGTSAIISSSTYHVFECAYSGTNNSGVGNSYTIAVGSNLTTGSQIINHHQENLTPKGALFILPPQPFKT